MKKISIICPDNGAGLSRDAKLLMNVLLEQYNPEELQWVNTRGGHFTIPDNSEVNIFLEIIEPRLLSLAKRNVIIPNPEWFFLEWLNYKNMFDLVIAKTKDCERIFKAQGFKQVLHTSFTSIDLFSDYEGPNFFRKFKFAHFAGKSTAKGTKEVIEAFNQPGMPAILITQDSNNYSGLVHSSSKIDYRYGFMNEDLFAIMMNSIPFHLCPSSYEGFGHYINESKSVKAVVITTNAAPMNELISQNYGIGCRYDQTFPQNLGTHKVVSVDSICNAVKYADSMKDSSIISFGEKARESYLLNDKQFKAAFLSIVEDLLS